MFVCLIVFLSFAVSELLENIAQLQSCLFLACSSGHENLVGFWIDAIRKAIDVPLLQFSFSLEYDFLNAARKGQNQHIKGSQLGTFCSKVIQLLNSNILFRYLRNLKLFSVRVNELFEPIVLRGK